MNSCGNGPETGRWVNGCRAWPWFLAVLFFCLTLRADTGLTGTNLWTFGFPFSLPLNYSLSTPAVAADGTVYAGGFDGTFFAITPDGKERWRFQAGREIKSSPAVADDGTIYFGCRDRQFYALTPAGKLKWKFATGAWVDSSPGIAADGTIYFGSWDKTFYALSPNGAVKWKFATHGVVDSSPAIATDGTIYFGSHDKKFYALDPEGKLRWSFLTEAEVTSSPALGEDGTIYFTSTDGNLYHLKADGTEIWRCRVGGGGDGSPVLAENGNIFLSVGPNHAGVSPEGKVFWNWGAPVWTDETPAAAQGYICFAQPWRQLMATQSDGAAAWTVLEQEAINSSLVLGPQGEIYFCAGAHVVAVQAPVPELAAKSGWPMFRANARHTGRAGGD
jgi:outer membrane protein assembly factor BamB